MTLGWGASGENEWGGGKEIAMGKKKFSVHPFLFAE